MRQAFVSTLPFSAQQPYSRPADSELWNLGGRIVSSVITPNGFLDTWVFAEEGMSLTLDDVHVEVRSALP